MIRCVHTQCIAAEVDTIAHSKIEFIRADSYIDIPLGACFDFAVYDFESVHNKFYVVDYKCYDLMKPIANTVDIKDLTYIFPHSNIVDLAFVIDSINIHAISNADSCSY
ncbi:hypothetical protein V8G54_012599 [Vigna mungo]|uniref:Uncharacterized protein n=1 Tax=Vigna mungo TaxID=3915 RepID=A0AAQ3S3I3_VIGMU